ncbi:MAG: hypothetical protein B6227_04000 [Fusobacteriia bacterium 4572_74]|nr:MAG: hypothetical protein B6227_04000 [Fusobacteriia bacterium 4572_74]
MKKLLLLAAILAVGSTTFAVSAGGSLNLPGDTMYNMSLKANAEAGHAGGFGVLKDITTHDNAVNNNRAVNIFRDKGRGWEDIAATHILLKVIKPIKIESEIDFLYTEAVKGDELEIGDIGFRINGYGPAKVEFKFIGSSLFDAIPGRVTIKGHNGFYPMQTRILGSGIETASRMVYLTNTMKEIEVDAYLDLKNTTPGLKFGVIVARAEYQ